MAGPKVSIIKRFHCIYNWVSNSTVCTDTPGYGLCTTYDIDHEEEDKIKGL